MSSPVDSSRPAHPRAKGVRRGSNPPSTAESEHGAHGSIPVLSLAALGVVFGDIGTSPLYSLKEVFRVVEPTRADVFGVISMVFWTLMIIVSFKYATLVMRADNDGEGGILSLVALLRLKLGTTSRFALIATMLGITGASLFYGDSVITPAISVMSAIEGLGVASDAFDSLVLPLSLIIIAVLFAVQRKGTGAVGKFFGPIMAAWFLALAALGLPWILQDPEIIGALLPTHALEFVIRTPAAAFVALGAVVLCITGTEAFYADMGHFGKTPIRLAWFLLVFPCLIIMYLGMGAMLLLHPDWTDNPFFRMAPEWAGIPLVILATMATVIASQAVISGAFSVSRQATRLGLLPRLNVKHTSKEEGGQIYIGSINWILFLGVVTLIGVFESSDNLASAYGLAVTGTLLLESFLFLCLAAWVWKVGALKIAVAICTFVALEVAFFAGNIAKVLHGGWLPLLIAFIVITIMTTWRTGNATIKAERSRIEGSLEEFVAETHTRGIARVPGLAVFPHPDRDTTPLALRQLVDFTHVLHEQVAIVSVINENVPHIRHVDRAEVHDLGYSDDGLVHISYRVGFNDSQDVPKALLWAQGKCPEVDLDPDEARYFLSSLRLDAADVPSLRRWRKQLFLWLASVEANRTSVFHLPPEQTVVMGGQLKV